MLLCGGAVEDNPRCPICREHILSSYETPPAATNLNGSETPSPAVTASGGSAPARRANGASESASASPAVIASGGAPPLRVDPMVQANMQKELRKQLLQMFLVSFDKVL